jgi:hypothetical protein
MSKANKTYKLEVEYTVKGSITVEAANEEEARERALDKMVGLPTGDITDWDVLSVKEEKR